MSSKEFIITFDVTFKSLIFFICNHIQFTKLREPNGLHSNHKRMLNFHVLFHTMHWCDTVQKITEPFLAKLLWFKCNWAITSLLHMSSASGWVGVGEGGVWCCLKSRVVHQMSKLQNSKGGIYYGSKSRGNQQKGEKCATPCLPRTLVIIVVLMALWPWLLIVKIPSKLKKLYLLPRIYSEFDR